MTVDFTTEYLGLRLKNPLVASCSPITGRLDGLRRLEDAGIAAVILPSIFEEQLEHEDTEMKRVHELGAETFAEAVGGYFPELPEVKTKTEEQLELVREAKAALSIPVIASLNGHTKGGWVEYARSVQDAGADALELNLYFVPADVDKSGAEVEQDYLELVTAIREHTDLPLSLKLSPFFSSPGHMGRRLVEAGAQGLVLFNRFMQPDIDLETLQVAPTVRLSTNDELKLPLRWIAIMRDRIDASLAATTGVHQWPDIAKLLLVGADAVMATSVFLRQGPEYARAMLDGLHTWLEQNEYASIDQMKGSMSQRHSPDASAFERANYMAALTRYVWEEGW
jgi:dihydroorotate dehydrogenase (fumarate)